MATRNCHLLFQVVLNILVYLIHVNSAKSEITNICNCSQSRVQHGHSYYFCQLSNGPEYQESIQIIHHLMTSAGMDHFIIIYSSTFSDLAYKIMMATSKPVATYTIDIDSFDMEQRLIDVFFKVNNRKQQFYFLLLGETKFLTTTLQTVNTVDDLFNQQGYFTFLHRWIIFTPEENLAELQIYLLKIQHLTAISVSHSDSSVKIYSAMWKPWGRQFENIGMVPNTPEENTLQKLASSIFPNVEYGFNGQLLRVASQLWPIYVTIKGEDLNKTIYGGSFMEVLDIVSQDLNFTYEVKIAPDGHWGSKVNGTWNGIVGLLHNKQADISVAPLTTTPQRATGMDFAEMSVVFDTHVAIYKTPPPLQNTLYLYFKPFRNNVWLTIGLSWIGYSVFISIVYVTHTYWIQSAELSFRLFLYYTMDSLWYSFASFFTQNIKVKRSSMSTSCLWGTWWLFGLLIAMVWSGNIISFITIKLYPDLITGLDFLTQQDKYKILVLHSTSIEESMMTSNNSLVRQLCQNVLETRKNEPELLANSHDDLIGKVKGGGYVYIIDKNTLKLEAYNSNCSLSIIPESLYPFSYHFGMQKHSAYHDMFNMAAIKINNFGLYDFWARQYVKEVNEGACMNAVTSKPLEFYHVQSILLCFAAMLLISLLVLGLENVISIMNVRWCQTRT